MTKRIEMEGRKFGELTVVRVAGKAKNNVLLYECLCSCGKVAVVRASNLRSGNTKSCGHLFKEKVRTMHVTHGGSKERLHGVWNSIKGRCYNPNCEAYKNYGGRGIKMCEEWKSNYESFKKFAIEKGYNENSKRGEYTIERIDVNGNYEPDNCILIPIEKQFCNKTNNHVLTFKNETKTVSEFARDYNIQKDTLLERLKAGWSVEDALLTPVRKMNRVKVKRYEVNGEIHSIKEWAEIIGVRKSKLKYLMSKKALEDIVSEIRSN